MPYRAIILFLAVGAGVGTTAWLLSSDNPGGLPWPAAERAGIAAPADSFTGSGRSAATDLPEPPTDNALGFALARVADQYQQTLRYPDYSIPLTPAQAEAYQGNRYQPVALPLENGGAFRVTLDRFRFSRGAPILIAATLSGRQVFSQSLSATLETTGDRRRAASAELPETEPGYYQGTLGSNHEPGEYRLIVEARIDGKPVRLASSLTIEPDLGSFEGLDAPYISGNDLVIPVHFEPETTGHYALSAQLFQGDKPVALLQQESALSSGSGPINLKAHGSVVAERDATGPWSLRNLQIRRMPAAPGDRTDYGFGPDEGFEFSPPDLDRLRNEPAVNPESELRAALLRQMADKL